MAEVKLVVHDAFGPHGLATMTPEGYLQCHCGFVCDIWFWLSAGAGVKGCPSEILREVPWQE